MKQPIHLMPLMTHSLSKSVNEVPDNIIQIGAPNVWDQGYTGDNTVIAVLDTGCDTQHPDLAGRIIGGRNFTDDFNGNQDKYEDNNGHGTHAAGIIAAVQNGKGIVGVAPDARLLIIKVLNQYGSGTVEILKEALLYAMNWRGPNRETVDIISLSLGVKNYNRGLHETIRKVVQSGRVVVAAAGNDGDGDSKTEEYRYPGGFPEVVQVGAMDVVRSISYFSNTNQEVDLYAPGEKINSTFPEGGYAKLSGTSMAAPHVAGALALLVEAYRNVYGRKPTVIELRTSLKKHTRAYPDLDQNALSFKKMLHFFPPEVVNDGRNPSLYPNNLLKEKKQMNINDWMKCYAETSRLESTLSKCLLTDCSEEEKGWLVSCLQQSSKTKQKIREFCKHRP